jgi:hypothetical protein
VLTLVTVPVLYVLTLPVFWEIVSRKWQPGPTGVPEVPSWYQAYVVPYTWLDRTPIHGALETYMAWAGRMLDIIRESI